MLTLPAPHGTHQQRGLAGQQAFPYVATLLAMFSGLGRCFAQGGGTLIYCEEANLMKVIVSRPRACVHQVPYRVHAHRQEGTQVYLITPQGEVPFPQGGVASMQAVAGAQQLLYNLAVTEQQFYRALASFPFD